MKPKPPSDPAALRRAAEARHKARPATKTAQTKPDARRLQHELEVHQIELEMQNEELRAAQADVEAALERFTAFFDFAPVGYFGLTADGTITLVNLAGARLEGIERSRLTGRRFGQFVVQADRRAFSDLLAQVFTTGDRQVGEFTLVHEVLGPMTVRLEATLAPGGGECRLVMLDITARRQAEAIIACQAKVLEMIALGSPLEETLTTMLESMEAFAPDMLCSVLLLDADGVHIRHGAAPSLPDAFNRAIEGLTIGPGAGSCGTAAFRREPVFVEDIATDPLWKDYRALAATHGLRACWSTPILDEQGRVLGTFAIYYRQPGMPTPLHRRCIDLATHLAAVAIVKHRDAATVRASEARLRAIFDNEPECVKLLAADGSLQEMNPAGLRMLEADTYQQVGKQCVYPLIVEEHRAAFRALTERVFEGETGFLEFQIIGLKGGRRWLETHASPLRDESGRIISLLGITRDITDRKQAEAAARESAERIRFVVEGTGTGLWDWDLATNEVRYSREWKRMLGYAEHEVADHLDEWKRLTHADDVEPTLAKVGAFLAEPVGSLEIEFRMRHKDGSWRWILSRATGSPGSEGRPTHMVGLHMDITERRKAEEALREKEQLLSEAQRIAHVGSWKYLLDGLSIWTEETYRIFGVSPDSFTPTKEGFFGAIVTEDRPAMQVWIQLCGAGAAPGELDFRIRKPDGQIRHLRGRGELVCDAERTPLYMAGTVQDITERRHAEDAVRGAEEKYRSIFHHAVEGIYQSTPEGRYLTVNPAMARIYGYASPEEMLDQVTDIRRQIYADPGERRRLQSLLHGQGTTGVFACQMLRKDGTIIWVQQSSRAVRDDAGNVICYEGSVEDITARREAEAVLRASEQKLRQVIDGLGPNNFVGLLAPDGTLIEANRPALAAAGLRLEDVQGKPVDQTYWFAYSEAAQQRLRAAVARAAAGEPSRFDVQIRVAEGRLIWLDFSIHPLRDAGGQVIYLIPSATVIEERKQAETSLQRQHGLLAAVVEGTGDAVFAKDLEGRYLIINSAGAQALGRPAEEILGHTDEEFVPEATARRFREADEAVMASGQMQTQEESGLMGGALRAWHANKSPLRDADGRTIGVIGVSRDITDRMLAEAALRQSEERFAKAFDASPAAVNIATVHDGRLLNVNERYCQFFGYTREEIIGRTVSELGMWADPAQRAPLKSLLLASRSVRDFEAKLRRKDGTVRNALISMEIIDYRGVSEPVLISMSTDITERKQAEEELVLLSGRLLRAQDDERRHMARELHDSTAQIMAALSMNLAVLSRTSAPGHDSRALLAECEAQAKRATAELRTFAYLLHPPALEALGLARAMQDYVEGFAQRTSIHVELDVPGDWGRLSEETELTLFRVLQESLGNIHRHSGSTTTAIRLERDAESVTLEVRDSGRGLGEAQLAALRRGHAVVGVGIAGMRERVRLLGGRLEIEAALPGVLVRATLPLAQGEKDEG